MDVVSPPYPLPSTTPLNRRIRFLGQLQTEQELNRG